MGNEIKVTMRKLAELVPYENNPRDNSKAVNAVAESIKEFGFKNPIIVDKGDVIVAGHTRYKAAEKLGLDEVPVIVANDLSDEQIKAFRLADNKTAELAEWNFDLLETELAGISEIDMSAFGFDMETFAESSVVEEDDYSGDVPDVPRTQPGDLWQMGGHRLVCGDSTDITVIDRLMDGVKADMVFTDPPYNIGYQGVSDKRTVKNDKMDDESFVEFLKSSLMNCETMYVCCSWQYAHLFRRAIEENGNKIKAMIVWDKVNPAQHLDKYFKQHEIIWYCGKFGGEKTLRGDIWQVKRQANTVHPTMKPIELIAMALQDNPDKKIVYDGFGGSGSTLIACEQLNRKCYMAELDPKYCDVIIQRWEEFTGQKAKLIHG